MAGTRLKDETGSPAPTDAWTFALSLEELWQGEMVGVRFGERDVLLINLGPDGLRAYDNRCPHAGSRLCEGRLGPDTLVCSAHLWEFDIRSGAGVNPRACQLRRRAVRVVDGSIFVQLDC